MTQKGWLGPYAPTDRHADKITIDELIRLRKREAELEMQLKNALDAITDLHRANKKLADALRDKL